MSSAGALGSSVLGVGGQAGGGAQQRARGRGVPQRERLPADTLLIISSGMPEFLSYINRLNFKFASFLICCVYRSATGAPRKRIDGGLTELNPFPFRFSEDDKKTN
jgi:hypothetical protein